MKLLKYIAILASAFAMNAAFAADPVVTSSLDNGVLTINVKMDVEANSNLPTTLTDALKKSLESTLASLKAANNGSYTKALSAAMSAIKRVLKNPSDPVSGVVTLDVQLNLVNENSLDVVTAKTKIAVGGESYEADTKTTVNPKTGSAVTEGKVVSTVAGQEPVSSDVNLKSSPLGVITGNVGDNFVSDLDAAASVRAENTMPASVRDAQDGASSEDVVPDNTLITSAVR